MGKKKNHSSSKDKLSSNERQLKAAIQQLRASEQQLKAANQQLRANEQQLHAEVAERKRAEEALAYEHYLFSALMDNIPDAIYFKDTESRFIRINKAQANRFSLKDSAQALGKTDFDFFTEEHAREAYEDEQKVMRLGRPLVGKEEKETWPDEKETWVSTTKVPLSDKEGKTIGTFGISRDITKRKEAEEKYRKLTESSLTGIFIHQDGKYVFVNDRFAEIHGYRAKELLGKEYLSLIHPDDKEVMAKRASQRLAGKEVVRSYEMRRLRKDSSTIWCVMMAGRMEYMGRAAIMGNIINITERKEAEEALQAANQQLLASEQQLKAANQQLRASEEETRALAKFPSENPNPVLRISADGTVLYSNNAGEPLLAEWRTEVGKRLPPKWRKFTMDAFNSGSSEETEAEYRNRILSLTFAPVVGFDYVNIYGLDITERKRAEESLQAANQRLRAGEQQLKAANQQLRASEQQLKAANQQLRASGQQLKSLASQLTLAEENERHQIATELHATIGQSLVVSKIRLDMLRTSLPSGDVAKMLDEVCESLGQTIEATRSLTFDLSSPILYELGFEAAVAAWLAEEVEEKHNIATEFEDDEKPKPLDDDVRVLLFRDVRELLLNVVKHSQAKNVKVSIRRAGSKIQVSVEDDGAGFDPAKIRVTAVRKGGFGLFSIRERLEELGGELEIKSAPGQGTKVTLIAPLKRKSVDEGEEK
jgi:PAS domain S-box-containing protein